MGETQRMEDGLQATESGQLAAELELPQRQIEAAIGLLDAGNTLPFIARYRKEVTGGLDEQALRRIEDGLARLRELRQRKGAVLKSIEKQGLLTAELRAQIEACTDRQRLEDLYLPFKPKRQTRAEQARQRGLQGLADLLVSQDASLRDRKSVLQPYIRPEDDVPDAEAALSGACDIVAEQWSEDAETRQWLGDLFERHGALVAKVKRGKKEVGAKFSGYFDYREPLRRIESHRFLAVQRGEAEGILRVEIELDRERVIRDLQRRWLHEPRFLFRRELEATVEDCVDRLLWPAVSSSVLKRHKELADERAIAVFTDNLRELLLAPPAGPQVTLGLDPGFRTGCKVAVVDETGKFLDHTTIYPTPPRNDVSGAMQRLNQLVERWGVRLIAIGNGTASREAHAFVQQWAKQEGWDGTVALVSEAGASIYSASELAAEEYPDLDVTVRGAISIAHRLQDPLAELVKLDPKSIGVGQYQHDVNQTWLKRSLDREVESCVSQVGVDVNLASAALLSRVAGIGPKLATKIVLHRDQQGRFEDRQSLLRVPSFGQKAFEQSAGFLRIRDGSQPLDNSAVHPERYELVQAMARQVKRSVDRLIGDPQALAQVDTTALVSPQCGLPTLQDILGELAKPGRDPRREFRVAQFAEGVDSIDDLEPGMILEGVVSNVTQFGAFVDIGVHQDGLVHVSELAHRFVRDPSEEVAVGDIVRVKVLEVDHDRRRIALSRKQAGGS